MNTILNIYKIIFFLLILIISSHSQPYGLTERIPNTSFLISSAGDTLAEMQLRRVFNQLLFTQPVFLTHAHDGSDRIFVIERGGIIHVFPNRENVTEKKIFLDISSSVNSGPSEAGLLSMAFHPHFPDTSKFYIYYTHGSLISRVSEFQVSASNPDSADKTSERVLFDLSQPYNNHNGGQIEFGPDGYLYIGLGDGGSGGDPLNSGQNPSTLLGSILRIDVNPSDSLAYTIPEDNPFNDNQYGWREEVWAYGLRNPWRFSFDRLNGDLWAGDVGQDAWEEVDLIHKGKNYGWRIMEGFHCYNPPSGCDTTGLTLPLVEYNHSVGYSITGGYVYRGDRLERLKGIYLYGDYGTRKIWGVKYENGQILENKIIAESPANITSFGEDEAGGVYIVGYNGNIYIFDEISGTPPVSRIPLTISESGLFTSIDSLIPAPGLIPYSVNVSFWSDGASKTRIIALPDTTKMDFSLNGSWGFPDNAVIVKNFFLDLIKGEPASRKIIETRFLVKRENDIQWDGYSYLWNEDETDATLLDTSFTRSFTITDGDSSYTQEYYYPSRQECNVCHNPEAGFVLGLRTAQINKQHLYTQTGDSIYDNQLRSYKNIRLFTSDIGEDYTGFPRLTDPFDSTADLETRARSYLDANCANCHRPQGIGRSNIDLRYDVPLEAAHILYTEPTLGDLGISGALRLIPGAPDSSLIYLRMLDTLNYRMPPIGSLIIDQIGSDLIRQWIDTLGVILHIANVPTDKIQSGFQLYPAYPNPFNPVTQIIFDLPYAAQVELIIYNTVGEKVDVLVDGFKKSGRHITTWNASECASGVYFVTLRTEDLTKSRKVLLIK
jgi:uncharacterized repeat protein (TIGR03806 family)